MKKKLMFLMPVLLFGLVACGGKKDPTKDPTVSPTPSVEPTSPSPTVVDPTTEEPTEDPTPTVDPTEDPTPTPPGIIVFDEGFFEAPCGIIVGYHGYVVPVAEYPATDATFPTIIAAYHLSNINVNMGEPFSFYKDGSPLTAIGPSGDDVGNKNFNNYIGSVENGLFIQNSFASADLHVGYYQDGGASFFLSGGNSADHTDYGSVTPTVPPVVDVKYSLLIGERVIDTVFNEKHDPSDGFEEYMALSVPVDAGEQVEMKDNENNVVWTIKTLNPDSSGFQMVDDKLMCIENGTYDFYLKFKWEADEVYIGKAS